MKPVFGPAQEPLEAMSALADGELSPREAAGVVEMVAQDGSLQAAWQHYQWIGEALRANAIAHATTSATRLHAVALASTVVQTPAANDSVWRWKLVAGFAALAAVGSIIWSVVGGPAVLNGSAQPQLASVRSAPAAQSAAPSLAQAPTPVAASNGELVASQSPQGVMIRDPRLDELLAAHKQFGSSSALQPAGFLHNATFQTPQR